MQEEPTRKANVSYLSSRTRHCSHTCFSAQRVASIWPRRLRRVPTIDRRAPGRRPSARQRISGANSGLLAYRRGRRLPCSRHRGPRALPKPQLANFCRLPSSHRIPSVTWSRKGQVHPRPLRYVIVTYPFDPLFSFFLFFSAFLFFILFCSKDFTARKKALWALPLRTQIWGRYCLPKPLVPAGPLKNT